MDVQADYVDPVFADGAFQRGEKKKKWGFPRTNRQALNFATHVIWLSELTMEKRTQVDQQQQNEERIGLR